MVLQSSGVLCRMHQSIDNVPFSAYCYDYLLYSDLTVLKIALLVKDGCAERKERVYLHLVNQDRGTEWVQWWWWYLWPHPRDDCDVHFTSIS